MVKAILFDLDGTLVDLEPRYVDAIRNSIAEVAGDLPEEELHYAISILLGVLGQKGFLLIPRTIWKCARKGLKLSIFKSIKFLFVTKGHYEQSRHTWILLEGASETIKYATSNFKTAIVTSAFEDEISQAMASIPQLKEFDVIVSWKDVKKPKPDKEPVLKASQLLGVPPDKCVMIGDLPSDILAAKSAGSVSVAYSGVFSDYTLPHLQKHNPDYIVKDQRELQNYLKELTLEE